MNITSDLNIGTAIANFIVIGLPIGYFVRKWINSRETTEKILFDKHEKETEKREKNEKEIRKELEETTEKIARNLEERHKETTILLLEKISDNKEYYTETYKDLKISIDSVARTQEKLTNYQKEANGKVAQIKFDLGILKQEHEDRKGKHERISDVCVC